MTVNGVAGDGAGGAALPVSGTKGYRFVLLLFISLLTFGSYFAYDSIGALATSLTEKLHLARSTIGNSYTAYSVAAILIVFVGGFLVDRLGTRRASLLFSCLVAVGALVVALARNSWELYAGRLIFGAGSESLVVAHPDVDRSAASCGSA